MKIGIRTPSVKKSIKARTTGAAKRKVKSSVDPFYGKAGMIKDPKKAIYNKAYNKTTVSAFSQSEKNNKVNDTPSTGTFGISMVVFFGIIGLAALLLCIISLFIAGLNSFNVVCGFIAFISLTITSIIAKSIT